jgi:hypothetical protein
MDEADELLKVINDNIATVIFLLLMVLGVIFVIIEGVKWVINKIMGY